PLATVIHLPMGFSSTIWWSTSFHTPWVTPCFSRASCRSERRMEDTSRSGDEGTTLMLARSPPWVMLTSTVYSFSTKDGFGSSEKKLDTGSAGRQSRQRRTGLSFFRKGRIRLTLLLAFTRFF